jgi:hypothetical protein
VVENRLEQSFDVYECGVFAVRDDVLVVTIGSAEEV